MPGTLSRIGPDEHNVSFLGRNEDPPHALPCRRRAGLAEAGYIVKQKNGRRNRYQIRAHLPLPGPTSRERTVGEVLALLAGTDARP